MSKEFVLFYKLWYSVFERGVCLKNDFEKIYSKMDKFMEDKNVTEDNINELMADFFSQYNGGTLDIEDTPLDKAMEKFSEAVEAKSEKKAIKLAKEAIKICPDYIEPYLFLIPFEHDGEDVLTELDKVITREKERLKKEGYFDEIGHFYGIWETRPYMRALHQRALVLLQYGKINLAKKELEEITKLNEHDNLGARYTLAAIYAYFEDEKKLKKLIKKYNEKNLFFLVSEMFLYYKLGDNKKTLEILKEIEDENPYFIETLTFDEIDDIEAEGFYQLGEKSEVMEVLFTQNFLLNSSPGLIKFIVDNVVIYDD